MAQTAADAAWDSPTPASASSPAQAASTLKQRIGTSFQAEKDVVRLAATTAASGAKTAGVGAGVAVVGGLIVLSMLLGAILVALADATSWLAAFLIMAAVGAIVAGIGYSMIRSGSGRISEVIETVKR